MAEGPAAGLAITDQLAGAPELRNYHLLPTVRGDFLERLGRYDEAQAAFQAAAQLAANIRERDMLERRAEAAKNKANQR
jgi:predicted RNA polymerase sigma factor